MSFYLATVSSHERCSVQQKILQSGPPQREAYNCFFAGTADDENKCFLGLRRDALGLLGKEMFGQGHRADHQEGES